MLASEQGSHQLNKSAKRRLQRRVNLREFAKATKAVLVAIGDSGRRRRRRHSNSGSSSG